MFRVSVFATLLLVPTQVTASPTDAVELQMYSLLCDEKKYISELEKIQNNITEEQQKQYDASGSFDKDIENVLDIIGKRGCAGLNRHLQNKLNGDAK